MSVAKNREARGSVRRLNWGMLRGVPSDAPVLEGSLPLPARGKVALLGGCTQGAGLCWEPGLCLGADRWLQRRWWCRRHAQQRGLLSASMWRVKDQQQQLACHRCSFLLLPPRRPWFALSRTWRGGKKCPVCPQSHPGMLGAGEAAAPKLIPNDSQVNSGQADFCNGKDG